MVFEPALHTHAWFRKKTCSYQACPKFWAHAGIEITSWALAKSKNTTWISQSFSRARAWFWDQLDRTMGNHDTWTHANMEIHLSGLRLPEEKYIGYLKSRFTHVQNSMNDVYLVGVPRT